MAASVDLVEVREGGVRLLGPAARGPPNLAWKRGEADRKRDLRRSLVGRGRDSGGSVAFPVRPGGRGAGTGQPVERDVVEDVVTGEVAHRLPVDERVGDLVVSIRVVIEHPSGQGDR